MDHLYANAIQNMSAFFDSLAARIEQPKQIQIGDGYTYRYDNLSIHAAILQKLARVITGIQAMHTLNAYGLTQEQAAIQRILDELMEDILFLTYSVVFDNRSKLHDAFLKAFYEEECDNPSSVLDSSQKRPTVSRRKIRAYVNNISGLDDPSTGIEVSRTIHKGYSGYVHGASPHIMELYYGTPPRFHLHGAKSSPLYRDHVDDLLNYYYRGILAFAFSAKAFADDDLFYEIRLYSKEFADESGSAEHLTPYS
ncbi:hypothetical protein [Ruegeria arenilitoris]|uniref:hypothetical protein n=1 Tax=Ruegeria arenilitoris TaxID=1173585 RepID=UPI00147F6AA7|nr:hypothetical protein [Ruegeria arenilitoris]